MLNQRRVREHNDTLVDNIDEFLEYKDVHVGDRASYYSNEGYITRIYRSGSGDIRCKIQSDDEVAVTITDVCVDSVVLRKNNEPTD